MIKYLYILILIGASSCTEPQYSCDPQIDKWVSQNLERLKTISRAEWLDINDIEYQRGAYAAFSTEQKMKLWADKLDEVLELDWTETEYKHIDGLREGIMDHPDWHRQDCPDPDSDSKELFMYKWLDYAANQLYWPKELIYAIAFTPESIAKDKTIIRAESVRVPLMTTRSETRPRCDCHNPESAQYYACDDQNKDCRTGNCEMTTWRCGWLWTYECNGLCYIKQL